MNTYFEYKIRCSVAPTEMTMHSVATHLLDGVESPLFKVSKTGRIVSVVTNVDIDTGFDMTFNHKDNVGRDKEITCKLLKKEVLECPDYQEGENVLLSGLISYSVNLTRGGKRCPFFKGRFEKDLAGKSLRDRFKANIERQLGVEVESMSREFFTRHPNEVLNDKIQLNNQIEMLSLPCKVTDPELFAKVHFNAFFQRKSYGFGSLSVEALPEE